MYVVVVGAGRVGVEVAKWLLDAEHEVTVIDKDSYRCAAVDEDMGSVTVMGDATEVVVQAKAGVNRADIFIATTSVDHQNLMACQVARGQFGALHLVSLVSTSEYQKLFEKLGIDVTINITDLMLGKVKDSLKVLLAEDAGGTE